MKQRNSRYTGRRPNRPCLGLVVALLGSWAAPAATETGPLIEEIIVTAQRVEEIARDVPSAVSAFAEHDINDRRIIGLDALQVQVPNVRYATTNVGDMTLSIRGVGSLVSVNDGESGVSLHVNEVPLPPGQPPLALFDVQRIEVLRGPEGTLYGRNATGGVINLLTHQPDFEALNGYVDVEGGDYDLLRVRGAVNLPLSDVFALRIAGLSLNRDGYTDNLAGGQVPAARRGT